MNPPIYLVSKKNYFNLELSESLGDYTFYFSSQLKPKIFENNSVKVIVLGKIRIDDKYLEAEDNVFLRLNNETLSKLAKGKFLVVKYDKSDGFISLLTDKTSSFPVSYRTWEGKVAASNSFYSIWKYISKLKDLNEQAFYDFLIFRRLLGSDTFDLKTRYLDSSSTLTILNEGVVREKKNSWMDFTKSHRKYSDLKDELLTVIDQSVKRSVEGEGRKGLLLSGGIDSRVPLLFSHEKLHCLSAGYSFNNECKVAKEVADRSGNDFDFLKRPSDNYDLLLPEIGFQYTDGMRDFHCASWLNVKKQIEALGVNHLVSGYAFDYLLGDNYLPRKRVSLFGKYRTFINEYQEKGRAESAEHFFYRTISWRYKNTNPLDLFKNDKVVQTSIQKIKEMMNAAPIEKSSLLDVYSFITTGNLSRHSMFIEPYVLSGDIQVENPGLDDDVLRFSLKIPFKYRLNYKLYKDAIAIKDKKLDLLKIRNANNDIPALDSPVKATSKLIASRLIEKAIGKPNPKTDEDRSWGSAEFIFNSNPQMNQKLLEIRESNIWEYLPELNKDYIFEAIERHFSGEELNLILMRHLLVITHMINIKES